MLLLTVIIMDHELVLFPESSLSQMYFQLGSISKDRSFNFRGFTVFIDPKQALKWCLGSTAVGAQYGAVASLSFNKDCTRLLSGFARGQMTMWDLTSGKLLRSITDAHPPGTAVLHIKVDNCFINHRFR